MQGDDAISEVPPKTFKFATRESATASGCKFGTSDRFKLLAADSTAFALRLAAAFAATAMAVEA